MFLRSLSHDPDDQNVFEKLVYPPLFFMDHRIVFICICEVLGTMYDNVEHLVSQNGFQGTDDAFQRLDQMVEQYILRPGTAVLESESRNVFENEKQLIFRAS